MLDVLSGEESAFSVAAAGGTGTLVIAFKGAADGNVGVAELEAVVVEGVLLGCVKIGGRLTLFVPVFADVATALPLPF